MGLETFPEIENFQKLPHQVIVKGGGTIYNEKDGAELRGIVINNIGHTIRDVKVHVVLFDGEKIPILNTSIRPEPQLIPQGGIAPFLFRFPDHKEKVVDYYLYANWKFDDHEA